MRRRNTASNRSQITSLARGLEVLRAFKTGITSLGNGEIAERTKLPRSTVSRLTETLSELGYLVYDAPSGRYQPGAGILALGYAALSGLGIRGIALPMMKELADLSGASVGLGGRDRLCMIYMEHCRGRAALMLNIEVGSRIPISTTAMGRAYLSALPSVERDTLLDAIRRHDLSAWPSVKKNIERSLREIADKGFCVVTAEWQRDVNSVGAPVIPADSAMPLALNCGGPPSILPRSKLEEEIGPRVAAIASRLSSGTQILPLNKIKRRAS